MIVTTLSTELLVKPQTQQSRLKSGVGRMRFAVFLPADAVIRVKFGSAVDRLTASLGT